MFPFCKVNESHGRVDFCCTIPGDSSCERLICSKCQMKDSSHSREHQQWFRDSQEWLQLLRSPNSSARRTGQKGRDIYDLWKNSNKILLEIQQKYKKSAIHSQECLKDLQSSLQILIKEEISKIYSLTCMQLELEFEVEKSNAMKLIVDASRFAALVSGSIELFPSDFDEFVQLIDINANIVDYSRSIWTGIKEAGLSREKSKSNTTRAQDNCINSIKRIKKRISNIFESTYASINTQSASEELGISHFEDLYKARENPKDLTFSPSQKSYKSPDSDIFGYPSDQLEENIEAILAREGMFQYKINENKVLEVQSKYISLPKDDIFELSLNKALRRQFEDEYLLNREHQAQVNIQKLGNTGESFLPDIEPIGVSISANEGDDQICNALRTLTNNQGF